MSALVLYLYNSNNSIAYKTASGDDLNVKRPSAESEGEDQVVNGPVGPSSTSMGYRRVEPRQQRGDCSCSPSLLQCVEEDGSLR